MRREKRNLIWKFIFFAIKITMLWNYFDFLFFSSSLPISPSLSGKWASLWCEVDALLSSQPKMNFIDCRPSRKICGIVREIEIFLGFFSAVPAEGSKILYSILIKFFIDFFSTAVSTLLSFAHRIEFSAAPSCTLVAVVWIFTLYHRGTYTWKIHHVMIEVRDITIDLNILFFSAHIHFPLFSLICSAPLSKQSLCLVSNE